MDFFPAILPWGEFGLLSGFPPSLCTLCSPICVEYGRVILPCRRLCQRAHSECSRLMELFGVPWPEDMECSRCENHRFFMDHCFFCSIFKIICLLVHQFLWTFRSVYITYNFEQKFHASELFISLGIWNEMKKVEKEKHFSEENFKVIKKNIIKILIVWYPSLSFFFFFSGYKSNAIYKGLEDIENIINCCLIIKYL